MGLNSHLTPDGWEVDPLVSPYAKTYTDPTTGQTVIVGPDGVPISLGGLDSVAVLDLIDQQPVSAPVMVEFPSPYRGGGDAYLDGLSQVERQSVVHPSVIHIPGGLAGFEFWAATTPYPGSNNQYETPCVYCSRDGINWQVPDGVNNPLVQPPASGFLSDVYLTTHAGELYLIYRSRVSVGGVVTRTLLLMTSRDGSTWTAPEVIYTADSADSMSPSFIWREDIQRWHMYYHYETGTGNAIRRVTSNSADVRGGFDSGTVTNIVLETTTDPLWWHSEFRAYGDEVFAVISEGSLVSSPGLIANLAVSPDGLKFAIKRLRTTYGSYKNSLVFVGDSLRVIYGLTQFGLTSIPTYYTMSQQLGGGAVEAVLSGIGQYPARQGLLDTFTRADSPNPGIPDRGPAWEVSSGSIGIADNLLQQNSTGNARILNVVGSASYDVRLRIDVLGTEAYLIAGFVNTQNFLRVGKRGANLSIVQVFNAGVITEYPLAPHPVVSGTELRVTKTGPRAKIFIDGELALDLIVPHLTLGSRVGVNCSGASYSAFSRISATSLR